MSDQQICSHQLNWGVMLISD